LLNNVQLLKGAIATMNDDKNTEIDKQSTIYTQSKIKLSVIHMFLELLLLGIGALTISKPIYRFVSTFIHNEYLQLIAFFIVFGGLLSLMLLPLEFYQGYVIEHKFKLSNQTFLRWCIEELKSLMVSLIIGVPLLLLFYFFIKLTSIWWLYFAIVVFIVAIVLAKVAPVLIFPLFYKFTPIDNEQLKNTLNDLMQQHGLKLKGIYSFNLSKYKQSKCSFYGIG